MGREKTVDEIRQEFLEHIGVIIHYWETLPDTTVHERLSGLVFSILSTLDGCSGGMPGFIVAPSPHPDDKEYNIAEGENYYPQNHESDVKGDIAGGLHELLHMVCK